jgi:hypothetical protein
MFATSLHGGDENVRERERETVTLIVCIVTIQPCPSSKQAVDRSVAALKRHARDFMGQPRSSGEQQKTDDDAGLSYLESAKAYEYDTLTIRQMIM